MSHLKIAFLVVLSLLLTVCSTINLPNLPNIGSGKKVKLYALDCGHISIPDMAVFSSEGEYDGKSHEMAVICFLIRHPKGDLIWDAGLPDAVNAFPEGQEVQGITITVPVTLSSQLSKLGITPAEIEYFSPSHSHFDHVGNAAMFAESTLLIRKSELDFMFGLGQEMGLVQKELVEPLRNSETILIESEYDVFGDGSVMILPAFGHTPGHNVLFVDLKQAGTIALTGDLYHLEESRERRIIPQFNFSKPETIDAIVAFEKRVEETQARVIIQHSQLDRDSLPTVPDYLE